MRMVVAAQRRNVYQTPKPPLKEETKMNLQPAAVDKLKELVAEEGNPELKLRVFVQGGGCSGFSYGFTFDEAKNEDDFDFTYDTVQVVVDAMSMQYLQNSAD
jgi:iron-sulfur cluster insertion protein